MTAKIKVSFDKNKLKSAIQGQVKDALQNRSYDVECPFCNTTFRAEQGANDCPHCHKTVDLKLNVKF